MMAYLLASLATVKEFLKVCVHKLFLKGRGGGEVCYEKIRDKAVLETAHEACKYESFRAKAAAGKVGEDPPVLPNVSMA